MEQPIDETINPWQSLSHEIKYDNPWIRLTEHQVINPSGGKGIYGVVQFKNKAIGVVPVDEHGFIWLVGQYRFPLNQYSWEIPEGGGPLAIEPLFAAKRELLEETGISAQHYELILEMHLSNSVSDEHALIYLATDLSFGTAEPEETEMLAIQKISLTDAYEWVNIGKITDSLSVAAILKLRLMQLEGKL
jgi:ADP-ribose pyrophosphatase